MNLKSISLAIILAMTGAVHAEQINRSENATEFLESVFTGTEQYSNFYRMEEIFPTNRVLKSGNPVQWPVGKSISLPDRYTFQGEERATQGLLTETETSALLVIKDGQIRYENYWLTGGEDHHWMSMSVAKSLVSVLMGVAVSEGMIESVEDTASKYLPELKGSAYEGVRLKDILQMSSGARWSEDYSDEKSEVNRLLSAMTGQSSFLEFVGSMKNELKPGTFNRYNSADTLVLGLVLERVTGKTLAAYTQEKLWGPLGATDDAYWITDKAGHSMAFGGFNATARDYARLGELYRLGGKFNGKQIVPEKWVNASLTADAPHLVPGDRENGDSGMGYGYQWWLLEGGKHDYSAIGVYNQFIYVSPEHRTVIVKLSAPRNYGTTKENISLHEDETFELFRKIAESMD
ncbi:serine hydrolase [Pseudomonas sp. PA15(2017)]|uniref:serine hydrolase domain-containing protein n=1 Tax=Pseudomonas sp. PA15(2017) TaxID=1932111 RepID=UPI000B2EFE85|nr:serine hydrolase [Pseudomonas sp. PA15(2017)]